MAERRPAQEGLNIMRMWMVSTEKLCSKHLLGEHGEHHKHLWCWVKRYKIDKRISGNAIEPKSYKNRHDLLAKEMDKRGYKHNSPLEQPDFSYLPEKQRSFVVDVEASIKELVRRCPNCRGRM